MCSPNATHQRPTIVTLENGWWASILLLLFICFLPSSLMCHCWLEWEHQTRVIFYILFFLQMIVSCFLWANKSSHPPPPRPTTHTHTWWLFLLCMNNPFMSVKTEFYKLMSTNSLTRVRVRVIITQLSRAPLTHRPVQLHWFPVHLCTISKSRLQQVALITDQLVFGVFAVSVWSFESYQDSTSHSFIWFSI